MTRVEVKREHIDRGEPRSCRYCAVTKAIEDIVKNDVVVATDFKKVRLLRNKRLDLHLPVEARQFISLYDDCETDEDKAKVEPIAFDLDIPAEFLRGESS